MASKKPKITIEGEMADVPSWNYRWGKTSERLTAKFEEFEYDHLGQTIHPFDGVEELDIKEDGKFSLIVTMSKHFRTSGVKSGWHIWKNVQKVVADFEDHCAVGQISEDEAKAMASDSGILEMAWINKIAIAEE